MKCAFGILIYCTVVHVATASDVVIWRQELSCDPNSTCRPGAIATDNVSNEVIILGTSERLQTREANFWLWKINLNGSVVHKKSLGPVSKYNLLMVGPFGIKATVKPDTGEIVRLKLDDVDSISLSITNRNMQSRTAKLGVSRKQSETFILHDMVSYQDDNLLLVGQDRGKDGIVIRTDLAGNVIWEKIFNLSQVDILSSITYEPNGSNFYVAGISVSLADDGKMGLSGPATVCLLRYDSNGELKASDFFEGGMAPWHTSFPRVIYLPSGVVLVLYNKSMNAKATELYVKAYTPELEPLYEKQILKTKEDGPPAHFDICATHEDRFVLAGKVNYKDLRLYECDVDGTILQTVELDGEVGAGGVHVDYLDGKIFVAFAAKSQGKKAKIKLMALKPYQAN